MDVTNASIATTTAAAAACPTTLSSYNHCYLSPAMPVDNASLRVAPSIVEAAAAGAGHPPASPTALGDSWLDKSRLLLYLLAPEETYVQSLQETPNLVLKVLPLVLVVMVAEVVALRLLKRGQEATYINYAINLTCTAIHDGFSEFVMRGAELLAYAWLYDNWRLCTLPWDSPYTFIFALLAVDYLAYWWHRASHEVAIIWAAHEFHHNSSEYNLGTAFRLGLVMRFYRWLFYLPTAIMGLPVATMWMHAQLGFLFNGLSHVSLVPPLGRVLPGLGHLVEFIFITPSHHKVHHAMNQWAIDRNYGVVLVLWDRLHSTFQEEREGQQLYFGTLQPVQSHDLLRLQNEPYSNLWAKVQSMETLGDKIRALVYGPGWSPGKPRLGLREDLPQVREQQRWPVLLPTWMKLYLLVNSFVIAFIYLDVVSRVEEVSSVFKLGTLAFLYFSYTAIGALYDTRPHALGLELIRNIAFLGLQVWMPLLQHPWLAVASITASVCNVGLLLSLAVSIRFMNGHHSARIIE